MLVTYRGGGHRVIEEALERAGVARRIALRVPHFTVVPMVLERTDLILTLPARVARVYETPRQLEGAAAAGADPAGRGGGALARALRRRSGQPLAARAGRGAILG